MKSIIQSIPAFRRVQVGIFMLAGIVLFGTLGYVLIGRLIYDEPWGVLDSLFMTIITVTTIGYGDVLKVQDGRHAVAMVYTMFLAVGGMGMVLYVVSMTTAFIVEGDLRKILWSRRMTKQIAKLEDHYIVCGVGETGKHVVEELLQTKRDFVVVDKSEVHIERCNALSEKEIPALLADATEDDTLLSAGVRHASGLVATLSDDRDNLFLTLTARQLNPELRIVAKAIDIRTGAKLTQAGANAVVSPNMIGGLRMVSELVRPQTVSFLDHMLRDRERSMRFEDLRIAADSPAMGKSLKELELNKRFDVLAIAARKQGEETFTYCFNSDIVLDVDTTLVVLGDAPNVARARRELHLSD